MSRIQASHSRAALARKARNEQPVRIVSSQMSGEETEASISRMSSDRSAANDCPPHPQPLSPNGARGAMLLKK